MSEDKLKALEARIDKLEHALLVSVTWHHGQADYVRSILGPEAVQCAEIDDVQGLLNKLTRE